MMAKLYSSIIIHGGAWNIPKKLERPHLYGVKEACKVGRDALLDEKGGIEAVASSLTLLEEDETFDAGKGSFLNSMGRVELDAGLMEGRNQDFASVGSVSRIRNPILLCKSMLANSSNKLLVCEGAHQYAKSLGIDLIDNEELIIERELKRFQDKSEKVENYFNPSDTVGAVALDLNERICVGNTTGGTPGKPPGRIGDSPLVGCGIYAGKLAGIAATGLGEPIIKTALTKKIYEYNRLKRDIVASCSYGIKELAKYGWGGVIALDNKGNMAAEHNTEKMPFAYWNERDDKIIVKIKKE